MRGWRMRTRTSSGVSRVEGKTIFKPVIGSGRPRYEVTATASTRLILGAVVPSLLPPRVRADGEEPGRWWPQGRATGRPVPVRLPLAGRLDLAA